MTVKEAWDAIARAEAEALGDHLTFASIEPILSALAASPGITEKEIRALAARLKMRIEAEELAGAHKGDTRDAYDRAVDGELRDMQLSKSAPGIHTPSEKEREWTSKYNCTHRDRDGLVCRVCADTEIASLRAQLAQGSATPASEKPNDPTGQGRLLLNAYGRECYDAGKKSVEGSATPAVIREVTDEMQQSFQYHAMSAALQHKIQRWRDRLASLLPQDGGS